MKKIILTILLISTVLLCLASCGGTSGIAGTYVCEDRRPPIADDRFVLSHDFLRCAPSTRCRLFENVLPVYSHSFCRRRGLAGVFGSKKRAG